MNSNPYLRGRLSGLSVSLVLSISDELLRWQFPAYAAGEKLSQLLALLRTTFMPSASRFASR